VDGHCGRDRRCLALNLVDPAAPIAAGRETASVDLFGAPKSGMKLSVDVAATQLVLRSRPDPALLYLVLGAAALLGILGAVLAAPERAALEGGLFAALVSPVALFLVISGLRLRATCTVDCERSALRLKERRYLGEWEHVYPLDQVGAVFLLLAPPSGPLDAGRTYQLCLAVPDGAYLLAESDSAAALESPGRLLARFLGVPLERGGHTVVRTSAGHRRLLIGVLLYAVPVTVAVALLSVSIPDRVTTWVFPTTLAAIVLSQVGALLTLLYYRHHVPPPTETNPGEHAATETTAPALGEPDGSP
jgi:hypothetical protein